MKKRLINLLLVVCMVVMLLPITALADGENYEIWVNGVQVTDSNKNGITGAGISGTVSYNSESKTLTLANATLEGTDYHEYSTLYASIVGLTVELIGDNEIRGPQGVPGSSCAVRFGQSTSFTGAGALTATGGKSTEYYGYSYGIFAVLNLSISAETTIVTKGGETANTYGLFCNNNVVVSGSLIAAGGSGESTSVGVNNGGVVQVFGGIVDATGGVLRFSNGESHGIKGRVSIAAGKVTARANGDTINPSGFTQAPSYDAVTIYTVTAGSSESSAVEVSSPTDETYTKNKYVCIEASLPEGVVFTISQDPVVIENGTNAGTFKATNGSRIVDNIPGAQPITISGAFYSVMSDEALRITIDASNATESSPLNLILANVKAETTSTPFQIMGTSCVNLTLNGDNSFSPSAGGGGPRLLLEAEAQLTVTEQSTGSLAISGVCGAGIGAYLAHQLGGTLIVHSGTVTTTGDFGGAGISCKEVLITGGTVTANGSSGNYENYVGAGIGFGTTGLTPGSGASKVTITGGIVTATSASDRAPAIGGGVSVDLSFGEVDLTLSPAAGYQIHAAVGTDETDAAAIEGSPFTDSTLVDASVLSGKKYFYSQSEQAPQAPSITGPTTMTLVEGYSATETDAFTIGGDPVPTVIQDTTYGDKIVWNDATKKLEIAAGLTAGNYSVQLTAIFEPEITITSLPIDRGSYAVTGGILNGGPENTLTFSLTVQGKDELDDIPKLGNRLVGGWWLLGSLSVLGIVLVLVPGRFRWRKQEDA